MNDLLCGWIPQVHIVIVIVMQYLYRRMSFHYKGTKSILYWGYGNSFETALKLYKDKFICLRVLKFYLLGCAFGPGKISCFLGQLNWLSSILIMFVKRWQEHLFDLWSLLCNVTFVIGYERNMKNLRNAMNRAIRDTYWDYISYYILG